MKSKIENLEKKITAEINNCTNLEQLSEVKIEYFSKKSEFSSILKNIGSLSRDDRKELGQIANKVKVLLEKNFNNKQAALKKSKLEEKLKAEEIDITLPGSRLKFGKLHPLTTVLSEITNIFVSMGFSIVDGDEIESTYYNFDALNIDINHPARDASDTFYLTSDLILRTQTSPVQIHVMEKTPPPIKVISPGKVYRSDDIDSTHAPMFHQIEGLVVDENISMAHLKGTLEYFMDRLYGKKVKTRFRPHHFPFTEPSAEMDVECFACSGEGCKVCKNEGWIEVLGCGMVHENVFKKCKIDSSVYSGFAFGMGLERIVMQKFRINDLRLFFENDLRFLAQF